jgi:hypothetical protein
MTVNYEEMMMGMTEQERVANEFAIQELFDRIETGLSELRLANEQLEEAVKRLEAEALSLDPEWSR